MRSEDERILLRQAMGKIETGSDDTLSAEERDLLRQVKRRLNSDPQLRAYEEGLTSAERKVVARGYDPTPHPTDDELAGSLDGSLTEEEDREVRAHLGTCAECREVADGIMRMRRAVQRYEAKVAAHSRKKRVERQLVFAMSSGMLLLLVWFSTLRFSARTRLTENGENGGHVASHVSPGSSLSVQLETLPEELKQVLKMNAPQMADLSPRLAGNQFTLGTEHPKQSPAEIQVQQPDGVVVGTHVDLAWKPLLGVQMDTYCVTYTRLDPESHVPTIDARSFKVPRAQTKTTLILAPGTYLWSVCSMQGNTEEHDSKPSYFHVLSDANITSDLARGAANIRVGNLDEATRYLIAVRVQQQILHNTVGVQQADQWVQELKAIQRKPQTWNRQ